MTYRKAMALSIIFLIVALSLFQSQRYNPLTVAAESNEAKTVITGTPNATISFLSPKNITYQSGNITVEFVVNGQIPPLESAPAVLFQPYFRYGCFLDYDIISNRTFNIDQWNPNRPGFIPNSNIDVKVYPYGDVWICRANLTNVPAGTHYITAWIQEEQNYISTGNFVGSVFSTVDFTINPAQPLSTPSPTSTTAPSVPEFSFLTAILLFVILTIVSLGMIKRYKPSQSKKK